MGVASNINFKARFDWVAFATLDNGLFDFILTANLCDLYTAREKPNGAKHH